MHKYLINSNRVWCVRKFIFLSLYWATYYFILIIFVIYINGLKLSYIINLVKPMNGLKEYGLNVWILDFI